MKGRPIAVDLDGTLFVDDSAWENLRFIILRNPTKVPALLIQAFFGRASLKDWLHREAGARRNPPAIRQELLARLLSEKKRGVQYTLCRVRLKTLWRQQPGGWVSTLD